MLLLEALGVEVVLKLFARLLEILTPQHHGLGKGFHNYKEDGREVELRLHLNKIR